MKTKYTAKHVYWDRSLLRVINSSSLIDSASGSRKKLPENIIRFDSIHEFKVYRELTRMFGAACVDCQVKLNILLPCICYPNGKTWKVDFGVKYFDSVDEYAFYVEAKGVFLPEFGTTLAMLEQFDPDEFDKVRIVFSRAIPKDNRVVKALLKTSFKENLYTLSELEAMRCLK